MTHEQHLALLYSWIFFGFMGGTFGFVLGWSFCQRKHGYGNSQARTNAR